MFCIGAGRLRVVRSDVCLVPCTPASAMPESPECLARALSELEAVLGTCAGHLTEANPRYVAPEVRGACGLCNVL